MRRDGEQRHSDNGEAQACACARKPRGATDRRRNGQPEPNSGAQTAPRHLAATSPCCCSVCKVQRLQQTRDAGPRVTSIINYRYRTGKKLLTQLFTVVGERNRNRTRAQGWTQHSRAKDRAPTRDGKRHPPAALSMRMCRGVRVRHHERLKCAVAVHQRQKARLVLFNPFIAICASHFGRGGLADLPP